MPENSVIRDTEGNKVYRDSFSNITFLSFTKKKSLVYKKVKKKKADYKHSKY